MKRYRVTTPRRGEARGKPTLLYVRWRDMRSRTLGRATRSPELYEDLELGWKTFAEFRAYAVANGFSKRNNSPDRIDTTKGYVSGNVRFVPKKINTYSALGLSDYATRGPEPEYANFDDVPF